MFIRYRYPMRFFLVILVIALAPLRGMAGDMMALGMAAQQLSAVASAPETNPSAAGERIRLAPLPFIHANRVVDAFDSPDTWNADYADRVQGYEDILAQGLITGLDPARDILLFAAHLHVGGASYSGTERQITVSDAYATRAERLPVVSYAAFGHIHKPQRLPGPVPGRYAGSPIQLDFGEEGEEKQVVLVEAAPGQ